MIGNPFPLKQNAGKSFQGSIVLGKGFVLSTEEAESLISKDQRNKDVIFPYLNGEDLNNDPEQRPSRWVINFFDWSEEKARSYPDCFALLEQRVKPERQRWKIDEKGNEVVGTYALRKPLPQKWWIYGEKRPTLYETISKLDQVMVIALTSKTVAIALVPSNQVYSHSLGVFSDNSFSTFCYLQSTIHNIWAWTYGSSMKSDLRYTPSICFESFPIPMELSDELSEKLSSIGSQYNSLRKEIMVNTGIGLTRLYSLFHSSETKENKWLRQLSNQDSALTKLLYSFHQLRDLHVQLDKAILETYGWDDINVEHGFYELEHLPEGDRVRFTINPITRKEIMRRLLKLNHQLHTHEMSKLPGMKVKSGKKGKVTKGDAATLF